MDFFYLFAASLSIISAIHFQHVLADGGGSIGINYGRIADNLPSPMQVVELLRQQGITKAKIYDTDSSVLSAFASSGVRITVALPNERLAAAAASPAFTDSWVQSNILPNRASIESIAVGNEVFVDPSNVTAFLVPAMGNVYGSLVKFGVGSIKVSSPIALTALQTSYPPSAGNFKEELIGVAVKPMLSFLRRTNSSIMVNAYPFFAYTQNVKTIDLNYALLGSNSSVVTDPNNGLVYRSLFEAQIDAVYAAMAALNFNDINIIVTETGWPSQGDANEVGAGITNAAAYNGNLVRRVLTGSGTPLRPRVPLNVYLFALFNENQKPGPTSERNYGLFYPDQRKVYDIPLRAEQLGSTTAAKN